MIRAVTITQNWQEAQQDVPLGGQAQSTRCEAQRAEHQATVRLLLYLNCSFVIALVIQNNHINPTTSQMLTQTLQHCINHDPEWLRRNGISLPRRRKQILKKKDGSQNSINENYRLSCENLSKWCKIVATHIRMRAWLRLLPRAPTATKHKTSRLKAHKTSNK